MDSEVKHSIGIPIEEVPLVKEALKLGWIMTEVKNIFEWTLTKKNFGGGWDASVTLQGSPEEVAQFTQTINGVLGGTTIVTPNASTNQPVIPDADMGEAPDCPAGHGPMRVSKFGGWFCSFNLGYKLPDGKDAFCQEKVK